MALKDGCFAGTSGGKGLPEPLEIDCRGEEAHERGCRLEGLWYDTQKQVFVVESAPGEPPLWTQDPESKAAAQRTSDTLYGSILVAVLDLNCSCLLVVRCAVEEADRVWPVIEHGLWPHELHMRSSTAGQE